MRKKTILLAFTFILVLGFVHTNAAITANAQSNSFELLVDNGELYNVCFNF